MDNQMCMEFSARSENESFARICAAAFAASANPTAPELAEIKTAVSEAVTNAIIHGYENCDGIVKMEGRIVGKRVEFTIIDEGWGIEDVEKAREPLYTGKPELERSGMGFSIMETFSDKLRVVSSVGQGTRVTMTRKLSEFGK